jgi:MFS family permease
LKLSRLLVPDVRGLPRAFWLLFSAALIDRIGGFAAPYLAIFLTGKAGVSVGVAGLIVSLLAAGGLLGGPLGGALADRYGRKPMLVGGFVATACSWIVVSQARGMVAVAVTVFIAGVASSLPRPAMSAAIADVVPEAGRRRAFGLHYWAINLGFAVAASAAGFLADVSWNLVFGLDAMTSIVAAVLLFAAMKDAAPVLSTPKTRMSFASLAGGPLKDGVFMLLVLQGFMNASMFSQCTVPLAAEMKLDGLASHYGPLLAINGVLIVLLQPTLTQVSERLSQTRVLAWGCALTGGGFFLTALCDRWWHYAISIGVWTIGEILLASTMPAVIARLAPENVRATYQGMYMLSWSAASFAPAGGAFLLERWGSWALWGLCLVAGSVGVLVQRRLSREPRMG